MSCVFVRMHQPKRFSESISETSTTTKKNLLEMLGLSITIHGYSCSHANRRSGKKRKGVMTVSQLSSANMTNATWNKQSLQKPPNYKFAGGYKPSTKSKSISQLFLQEFERSQVITVLTVQTARPFIPWLTR